MAGEDDAGPGLALSLVLPGLIYPLMWRSGSLPALDYGPKGRRPELVEPWTMPVEVSVRLLEDALGLCLLEIVLAGNVLRIKSSELVLDVATRRGDSSLVTVEVSAGFLEQPAKSAARKVRNALRKGIQGVVVRALRTLKDRVRLHTRHLIVAPFSRLELRDVADQPPMLCCGWMFETPPELAANPHLCWVDNGEPLACAVPDLPRHTGLAAVLMGQTVSVAGVDLEGVRNELHGR